MTAVVDPNYATDVTGGNRTKAQGKAIMRQMLANMRETIGGGADGTGVTIASDTITIVNNACVFAVDTEGSAATDDLKTITIGVSGDLRDGFVAGLSNANAARSVVVKTATDSSARRIYTRFRRDLTLSDTISICWLKYKLADDAWYQIFPDLSEQLDLMMGARPLATVSVSSSQITLDRGFTYIDSGAAADINQILSTKHFEGNHVAIATANATYVRTLKQGVGTNGKLDLIGGVDIAMAVNSVYVFAKTIVSTVIVYKHLYTVSGGNVVGPASVTDGRVAVFDGATGKLLKQDTRLAADLVAGPGSVTDGRLVAFDGGTGKLLKQDTRLAADLIAGPATATDKAVALYNGATGKLLKDGVAPGTSGNVLTSDGTNWTSATPAGSSSFTSSDQTITIAGSLTIAHGLSAAPKLVLAVLVNVTAEANYATGDVVTIVSNPPAIRFDATNLNIRYSSSSIQVCDKTSGLNSSITPGNWKMRFHAR